MFISLFWSAARKNSGWNNHLCNIFKRCLKLIIPVSTSGHQSPVMYKLVTLFMWTEKKRALNQCFVCVCVSMCFNIQVCVSASFASCSLHKDRSCTVTSQNINEKIKERIYVTWKDWHKIKKQNKNKVAILFMSAQTASGSYLKCLQRKMSLQSQFYLRSLKKWIEL